MKIQKNDDLLFRGIDFHDNVTFNTNTNKKIFIANANDIVTVKIPICLKDISDYFRQLNFPLEFCECNISIQTVDEIYIISPKCACVCVCVCVCVFVHVLIENG